MRPNKIHRCIRWLLFISLFFIYLFFLPPLWLILKQFSFSLLATKESFGCKVLSFYVYSYFGQILVLSSTKDESSTPPFLFFTAQWRLRLRSSLIFYSPETVMGRIAEYPIYNLHLATQFHFLHWPYALLFFFFFFRGGCDQYLSVLLSICTWKRWDRQDCFEPWRGRGGVQCKSTCSAGTLLRAFNAFLSLSPICRSGRSDLTKGSSSY